MDLSLNQVNYECIPVFDMNTYTALMVAGIGVIAVMAVVFGMDVIKMSITTESHSVFLDPIIDKQSLFVVGRVSIQNTGSEPLTNVRINFGDGDVQEIPVIRQGQKIILTPPEDNSMRIVYSKRRQWRI